MQDTEKIFYKLVYLKKISDVVTDTAAVTDMIVRGGTIKTEKEYIIQSIIFKDYDIDDVVNFCIHHDYKFKKIDYKKNNTIRARQYNPQYLKTKGYTEYKTHKINNNISFVIAYKKKLLSNVNVYNAKI